MQFWTVFSRIRTECGEIRSNSPYSVRMRETTDQNNSEYGHFLRSAASISFPNRTTTETATDTYMNIYQKSWNKVFDGVSERKMNIKKLFGITLWTEQGKIRIIHKRT